MFFITLSIHCSNRSPNNSLPYSERDITPTYYGRPISTTRLVKQLKQFPEADSVYDRIQHEKLQIKPTTINSSENKLLLSTAICTICNMPALSEIVQCLNCNITIHTACIELFDINYAFPYQHSQLTTRGQQQLYDISSSSNNNNNNNPSSPTICSPLSHLDAPQSLTLSQLVHTTEKVSLISDLLYPSSLLSYCIFSGCWDYCQRIYLYGLS